MWVNYMRAKIKLKFFKLTEMLLWINLLFTVDSFFYKNFLLHAYELQTKKEEPVIERVLDMVFAKNIKNREPSEISGFGMQQGRWYFFVKLKCLKDGEVVFTWLKNGQEYYRLALPVKKSPAWRTFSSVMLTPGQWEVRLYSGKQFIVSNKFTIY